VTALDARPGTQPDPKNPEQEIKTMNAFTGTTPEQRAGALAKAIAARRERAAVISAVKSGSVVIADALDDERVKGARVKRLILAVPGVGPVRAAEIMTACQIADKRRVRGLGARQRHALIATFAA
jgi:hypothetical protein